LARIAAFSGPRQRLSFADRPADGHAPFVQLRLEVGDVEFAEMK
jgi:hypothetical protein